MAFRKITVSTLDDNEVPACVEIISKSFGHDAPFVDAYFPNHDMPSGQIQGAERLLSWKQHVPTSSFLKAISENGTIIGVAIWTHMVEAPPSELEKVENVEEVWPDLQDRKWMQHLWQSYVVPRSEAVQKSNGRGVYVLELLAIDPSHQGRGAGTALVQWGTSYADEHGLVCVVESTQRARPCYEKCGMRTEIETMQFDVDSVGELGNRRLPELTFLTRQPAST